MFCLKLLLKGKTINQCIRWSRAQPSAAVSPSRVISWRCTTRASWPAARSSTAPWTGTSHSSSPSGWDRSDSTNCTLCLDWYEYLKWFKIHDHSKVLRWAVSFHLTFCHLARSYHVCLIWRLSHMTFVALLRLSLMTFVALLHLWPYYVVANDVCHIWRLSPYYICRTWHLSSYYVCRTWRCRLMRFAAY